MRFQKNQIYLSCDSPATGDIAYAVAHTSIGDLPGWRIVRSWAKSTHENLRWRRIEIMACSGLVLLLTKGGRASSERWMEVGIALSHGAAVLIVGGNRPGAMSDDRTRCCSHANFQSEMAWLIKTASGLTWVDRVPAGTSRFQYPAS